MKQYIKQSLLNHPVNSKSDSQTVQLWKNRYLKFLESLENQSIPDDTMYQVHHIVPRSWNLDLAKDDNNLIKLTIKQHIIAHHILSKTGDYQMKCAIRQMVNAKTDEELHKAVFVVNLRNIYNKWWKHHLSKPVINLHTLQVYSSAREASVRIGVTKQGIANSIRKQERSKGYFYAYLTDNLDIGKKLKELEEIESNKEKNRRLKISNGHTRRIINLNTKEIFDSVEDACKKYGITVSAINFAIRKCTTSKGCFFGLYIMKKKITMPNFNIVLNK